ncbi:metal-dependent hydrolase [candidate division KSB1 bacterium]|nr:metal-dependent hydrolase [candidate division KSB1 bacterium]
MFIGHFAVALAAKKAAPKVSLGTAIFASQFIDLLWPILLLLGFEHVRIDPGNTAFTPLDFYDYPISHSLLAVLAWACGIGFIYFLLRRTAREAVLVGACVLSHWVLDALTHRPDLPLFPGGETRVGFGLWNYFAATVIVELAMFVAGIVLYMRATTARDRVGQYAFWALIIFLGVIWLANIFSPPPPNETAIAVASLTLWLLVPWAYWIDRHRREAAAT